MSAPKRPIAFILASTDHGAMIVNRFDYKMTTPSTGYGVGYMLLTQSSYDLDEATMIKTLLENRRKHFGDGVVVLDVGANIGVFTVEWARHMSGWGHVVGIEAQERVFYALAGNIAVNNCFNAQAIFAAVSSTNGEMRVPVLNYFQPASFGSLELRQRAGTEEIGQPIDYSPDRTVSVRTLSIDSLALPRLDLMKVDVEGMEVEVLEGARRAIARHLPILYIENMKTDTAALMTYLSDYGYKIFNAGMNVLAIHPGDPTVQIVRENPAPVA